jgi:glycosyltransferase involved in cell wall biosynthesis
MIDVLIVTHIPFWRRSEGSEQRIFQLLVSLRDQGLHVAVQMVNEATPPRDLAERLNLEAVFASCDTAWSKRISRAPVATIASAINAIITTIQYAAYKLMKGHIQKIQKKRCSRAKPCGQWPLSHFYSLADACRFKSIVAHCQPRIILFQYIRTAYLRRFLPCGLPGRPALFLDTLDVIHQRENSFGSNGAVHFIHVTEKDELRIADAMDVVIGIQPSESEYFKAKLKRARVITAMHSHAIVRHDPPDAERNIVLFVGKNNPPNLKGLKEFIVRGWPLIHDQLEGNVELRCVGTIGEGLTTFPLPQGISLVGYADSLEDEYREATVVIAPLHFGGGLKIKVVEALCNGKALVTTPCGAQGLDDGRDIAFHVADDAAGMARQCLSLIGDPAQRRHIAGQALAYAEKHFSEAACYGELKAIIQQTLARRA